MRLLSATDFALRALIRMASEPDRRFSSDELAKDLAISRNHLQKVVQKLSDDGFVQTTRGVRGGVQLARSAAEIGVGAVVRSFEGDQAIVECFKADGGGDCTLLPECRLKGMLARSREAFFQTLDRYTLADCAGPIRPSFPVASAL